MKTIAAMVGLIIMIMGLCACAATSEDMTGAFGAAEMVFELDGKAYPLKSHAAPLIAAIGQDYALTASPSCVYDGEDKQYVYEHITVYTYPLDGEDRIDEIYITGGSYKTAKGIGIGSSLADMQAQYGTGWFDIDTMCVYVVSGDPNDISSQKLYFEMTDERVSGISYYSASNAG